MISGKRKRKRRKKKEEEKEKRQRASKQGSDEVKRWNEGMEARRWK